MSRTVSTRALDLRVEWLNKALGRPAEPWRKRDDGKPGVQPNPGNFHLDHCLGGWRIEEQLDGGGAHPTFGSQRLNKSALVDFIDGLLVAVQLGKADPTGQLHVALVALSDMRTFLARFRLRTQDKGEAEALQAHLSSALNLLTQADPK